MRIYFLLETLKFVLDWFFLDFKILSQNSSFHATCAAYSFVLNNFSANILAFGDVHHKNWWTYSDGTHTLGQTCYSSYVPNNLSRTVNFPTTIMLGTLLWSSHSCCFLNSLFSDPSLPFAVNFFLLVYSDRIVITVSTDCSLQTQKGDVSFLLHSLWLFSFCLEWFSWSSNRCSMGGYL